MTREELKKIEDEIGYSFDNIYLLQQAFTRRSFSHENGNECNEILEFIGDKSLDLAIIRILIKIYSNVSEFKYFPGELITKLNEGEFTEIKRKLVEKKMLAERIDQLQLNKYLMMGNSDIMNNVQDEMSVKEDLFEAILGAVTLDCNYNMDIIEKVVEIMLDPVYYLENGFSEDAENYIGGLQEWYQKKYNKLPVYSISAVYNGFQVALFVPDISVTPFIGNGKTKMTAKIAAAKKAKQVIDNMELRDSILDELGEFVLDRAINQLQELYQKGFIPEPVYHFWSEPNYEEGGTLWKCLCKVSDCNATYTSGSSKKDVKKAAALDMLNHIFFSGNYIEKETR